MKPIKLHIDKVLNELDLLLPNEVSKDPNVLMIDDDKLNLKAFRSRFRREANVFTAINKKEALDIINNNNIDIVFCDYRIPKSNGADILKEIVKIYPNIKRAIVTAYIDPKMRAEVKYKSNTDDIIYKPYSFEDIFSRIFGLNQIAS